jgi:hypothetical protein
MIGNSNIDFKNGTYKVTEPYLIEFIKYLNTLGINALFVSFFIKRSVTVMVLSVQDVFDARKVAKTNGVIILNSLFSLFDKYDILLNSKKADWDPNFFISFDSFEFSCVYKLTIRCREKVIQELNNNGIYPREVYCRNTDSNYSILPGYYIFFKNQEELDRVDDSMKQIIKRVCAQVLTDEDKSGFFAPRKIEIGYMDAVTNSYAMGHLARDAE